MSDRSGEREGSKWDRRLGWLSILALLVGLLLLARSVLVTFLIGLILAYAFDPVVDFLEKRRIPRPFGIWIIITFISTVIVLFLFFVIPVIQGQIVRAAERFPAYWQDIREKLPPYLEEKFGLHLPQTFEEISEKILSRLQEQAPNIFRPVTFFIVALFSNTARLLAGIANLIIIPFSFYYFLRDLDRLKKNISDYIPPRHRPEAYRRFHELDRSLSGFIRGQLLVILFLAVFYGAGLTFLGVDLAFVLGLIAALGEIVPYVGFIVGLSLSLLVAFLQFQDFLHPFYIILLFAAIQSVQGLFVAPLVMGRQVGLNPLVVIAAIYIGGDLFGFIGVLLAVPSAAVVVVALKTVADHYRRSQLYREGAG